MDRRGFLKLLSIASVAPTYFFAPRGGWLSRVKQYHSMAEVERDFGPPSNTAFLTAELERLDERLWRPLQPGDYDLGMAFLTADERSWRPLQPGDYCGAAPFSVGSPFALYDQNGVRVGKGQLVPLDRPTDPVLRLDRGPYRADLVLKKGVVLPEASELSIRYEVGSGRWPV